ncbi:hypothetical protein EDC04DRAFT_2655944 [Pisolithus marmoratus]|nr:hypothetical protein EDC04DRAFT_2655944 [Pisolithus marmoratus]
MHTIFHIALMTLCMKPYAHHGATMLTFLLAAWTINSFPKPSLASRLTLARLRMRLTAYSPRTGKSTWSACCSPPLNKSVVLGRESASKLPIQMKNSITRTISSRSHMTSISGRETQARQAVVACNFEPAKALVRGLAAIPTVALPTLPYTDGVGRAKR